MHVLIFVGLMCICLPNLYSIFLSWHDQSHKSPKKALNAKVCFQNQNIGPRNDLIILWPYLKPAVIGQRLLKYDTLAHVAALKLYHNRSKEFGDRGQLYNYTYTTHSFTTACVTHVDQVIKQLVVLMGIINVESGGLIGDTFR